MEPNLYAYEGVWEDGQLVELTMDPHAIQLRLSDEDRRRFDNQRIEEQDLGWKPNQQGDFVQVTDLPTGDEWLVATAPCGAGCRCAAIAVRVNR